MEIARGIINIIGVILCFCVMVIFAQSVKHERPAAVPPKDTGALRLATFNVHYIWSERETGAWGVAHWHARKSSLDAAFKALDADIIGFQEMESFAWPPKAERPNLAREFLLSENPDYATAVVGHADEVPSTQPIFYRSEAFDLLDEGWFFFSDTPDVIYSRTFNGSFPAFASWAEFADKATGQRYKVLNLHTDFASRSNRHKSMQLVAKRIRPWISAGENVFVLGDFNALTGSKTLRILEAEGIVFPSQRGASVHFEKGLHLFGAIDHIGRIGSDPVGVASGAYHLQPDEVWPSDHHPVILDVLPLPQ